MVVTVSSKGQVVIPAKARKALGVKPGTQMDAAVDGGSLVFTPIPESPVEAGFGMFKGKGDSGVRTLIGLRRRDRRHG